MELRDLLARNDLPADVKHTIATHLRACPQRPECPESAHAATRPPHPPGIRAVAQCAQGACEALLGTMTEGMVFVDSDGVITYANPALRAMLGYQSEATLEGAALADFTADQSRPILLEQLRRRRQGAVDSYELTLVRRDGEPVYALLSPQRLEDADGRYVGSFAAVANITARRRAEAALQTTLERLELALDGTEQGLWELDWASGTLSLWRKSAKVLGYDGQEIVAERRDWQARVHPEDVAGLVAAIQSHAEGETPGIESEYRVKTLNGEWQWVLCRGRVVEAAEDGAPVRLAGTFQDISRRKADQRRIAEYQNRLNALRAHLAVVEDRERRHIAQGLHDSVAQTLAAAHLKLGLLLEDQAGRQAAAVIAECMALIAGAMRESRSLVFELSPPLLHEMGLSAALEWLVGRFAVQNGLQIDFEDDGQPKPMSEDARSVLYPCVRETLTNVIKHAKATRAAVSVLRTPSCVSVTVEDDGVGFDPDVVGPDPTTLSRFGLMSIRERLAGVGGDVDVVSAPGGGTRVTMRVPLSGDEATEGARA